ncbi:MAG TPA: hypothetical protein VFP68_23025 [Burkholderiaceae bacterium]|nr:hypothetical protein [Burkholderiaceae bacterium]
MQPADRVDFNGAGSATGEKNAAEHWRELLTQIGGEIAAPLSAAIERVNTLAISGRIDKQSLRALREEIAAARRAGMVGQQLSRLGSGRVKPSNERVQLAEHLHDVLSQRERDLQFRGVQVRPGLNGAEVIADASLLFTLLNALLDWCVEHSCSEVALSIDPHGWPGRARLTCSFGHRGAEDLRSDGRLASLDTLAWRLVQQAAWTLGLDLDRSEGAAHTCVTLQFPRTVNRELDAVSAVEVDHGFPSSFDSKPLAGSHVLVLAARRDVRAEVREAIAHMGLTLDFVRSVEEAREFCRSGLPHAVVYEGVLGGERLGRLRDELRAEVPDFVFVEIVEEGQIFEVSTLGGADIARVGRQALRESLPSALFFELSKTL